MTKSLAPEVLAYYDRGQEAGRLLRGKNQLELWRTQDVLRRLLAAAAPDGRALRVLDVGGGAGVHAEWLAADGHQVELLDPVPLHVEQASQLPGVTATLGDARELPAADASVDVALLLGPLYHLPERADRLRSLTEARRVVRPGGLVVAATINRFAGLYDTMRSGAYFEPANRAATDACVATGELRPATDQNLFTTAYFHLADEVPAEFTEAGLIVHGQYGLEGAAWLLGIEERLDDPAQRAVVLDALRRAESEPSLLGISGHLLTVGSH
ncbi:methyltransferase domain-containing protein [Kitasatospora sp. NBC_01287]|uniref:class I SAM-dependent methyltransferase n=1 Tax=Kitasatospora sp. NBC_01287 TaxID=2903573 RepID=UPI00224CFAE6|nr:class I SAM-dependent methyltransferase [Kitasatospora sp. NBC_01287]MCX4745449.1 methyltransferase domain-containing protein [Kitasatospora sp. NBC_01287]